MDKVDLNCSTKNEKKAREKAAKAKKIIVKAGTNSLTDEDSKLDKDKLNKLVDDVMDMINKNKQVILVSSGAIGAGKGTISIPDDSIENLQAASTIGQSHLMRFYSESFERYNKQVAQILLTHEDLENPSRFNNFKNTIETLLKWDIIPIINENDAVAIEEIKVGDNDIISSHIAVGIKADLLVTLTDVGGVYTSNPKENSDAELIHKVDFNNFNKLKKRIDETSTRNFGGIKTKIDGARKVNKEGIPAIIAKSDEENILERIAKGEKVGTIFIPDT